MATFTPLLRKQNSLKSGEYPLMIRVIINRKPIYLTSGIRLQIDQWDDKQRKIKKHPNSKLLNNKLSKSLYEIQSKLIELESNNPYITASEFKKIISGENNTESFSEYFKTYIAVLIEQEKYGTHDKFEAVLRKLTKYRKGGDIKFNELNVEFLKKYESYLRNSLKNSTNTIHGNFTIIRKLINDAIREGLMKLDQNPFLKYPLKLEKTNRIFLTEDEILEIKTTLFDNNSIEHQVKNMFLFSCFQGGIRISDLLLLKKKAIEDDRINIIMHKTKEPINIKLLDKSKEILKQYIEKREPEDYIFPFLVNGVNDKSTLERFNSISSKTAHINAVLKKVIKKAGINKNVTFHIARHSFATNALKRGIRLEYVSKILGHGSLKTTIIYAKIVNSDIDKSMDELNVE